MVRSKKHDGDRHARRRYDRWRLSTEWRAWYDWHGWRLQQALPSRIIVPVAQASRVVPGMACFWLDPGEGGAGTWESFKAGEQVFVAPARKDPRNKDMHLAIDFTRARLAGTVSKIELRVFDPPLVRLDVTIVSRDFDLISVGVVMNRAAIDVHLNGLAKDAIRFLHERRSIRPRVDGLLAMQEPEVVDIHRAIDAGQSGYGEIADAIDTAKGNARLDGLPEKNRSRAIAAIAGCLVAKGKHVLVVSSEFDSISKEMKSVLKGLASNDANIVTLSHDAAAAKAIRWRRLTYHVALMDAVNGTTVVDTIGPAVLAGKVVVAGQSLAKAPPFVSKKEKVVPKPREHGKPGIIRNAARAGEMSTWLVSKVYYPVEIRPVGYGVVSSYCGISGTRLPALGANVSRAITDPLDDLPRIGHDATQRAAESEDDARLAFIPVTIQWPFDGRRLEARFDSGLFGDATAWIERRIMAWLAEGTLPAAIRDQFFLPVPGAPVLDVHATPSGDSPVIVPPAALEARAGGVFAQGAEGAGGGEMACIDVNGFVAKFLPRVAPSSPILHVRPGIGPSIAKTNDGYTFACYLPDDIPPFISGRGKVIVPVSVKGLIPGKKVHAFGIGDGQQLDCYATVMDKMQSQHQPAIKALLNERLSREIDQQGWNALVEDVIAVTGAVVTFTGDASQWCAVLNILEQRVTDTDLDGVPNISAPLGPLVARASSSPGTHAGAGIGGKKRK
nr:hypothetical protein [Candidatus Sigynarchaeota archaeon]